MCGYLSTRYYRRIAFISGRTSPEKSGSRALSRCQSPTVNRNVINSKWEFHSEGVIGGPPLPLPPVGITSAESDRTKATKLSPRMRKARAREKLREITETETRVCARAADLGVRRQVDTFRLIVTIVTTTDDDVARYFSRYITNGGGSRREGEGGAIE